MSELAVLRVALMPGTSPHERLADLFARHHHRLYRLARRLTCCPEDASDLVQEAFLRAARRATALPASPESAEAWLVKVLVNLCRDRYRRQAVRRSARARLERDAADCPETWEDAAVARVTVQEALSRLAPRRRAVVVLRELEGRSTKEVARLLGITQVTVRWHLAIARKEPFRRMALGPGVAAGCGGGDAAGGVVDRAAGGAGLRVRPSRKLERIFQL